MKMLTQTISNCTIAKECEDRNDYAAAWAHIQDDLQKVDKLADVEAAHVLLRGGSIATRTAYAERELARDWLSRSLAILDRLGDKENAAAACYALALNHRTEGTFSEAYIWLDESRHRLDANDSEGICKAEILRGICKKDEGLNDEALSIYNDISSLVEELKELNLKAKFYGERAIVKRKLATAGGRPGLYDEALVDYAGASWQHELAGDECSVAIVKNNAACLLRMLGRMREALSEVNEAISICTRLKARQNLAQFKETRSQIRLALGFIDEASADADESVSMLHIGGERALLTESLITQGRCRARAGLKLKAFHSFQRAQEVAEFIEFNRGLGLISLAILEEINDLDIDTRRRHHRIVTEKLGAAGDEELTGRHVACIRFTVEMFKGELGLSEPDANPFCEGFSLDATVLAFERTLIERALLEARGCQKEAARILGISAANLNHKLKHKHKPAKALQTYGHYRGVKSMSHIGTETMPNEALSDLGIHEKDELVLKQGCRINTGDVVILRSRGNLYIGIYEKEPGKVLLCPANSEFQTWEFDEGTFEIAFKVVGYIRSREVGKPDATIHSLLNDSSEARLPAS